MNITLELEASHRVEVGERSRAPHSGEHRPTAALSSSRATGEASRKAARATTTACLSRHGDPRPQDARGAVPARAFTLVELMVVLGVIGVLVGVLAPALWGARRSAMETRGGAQTREIGVATLAHMEDHAGRLPQLRLTPLGEPTGEGEGFHLPWLFGGARGRVNVFGAASIGADRKPLNAYLGAFGPNDAPEVFRDPLDSGTNDDQLTGFAPASPDATLYDLVGTSYVLNDHALDDVPCPFVELYTTLIPQWGGAAPAIASPSRTWLAGQSPIYNYDDGADKGEVWGRDRVRASLCFGDGHVKVAVPVAPGIVNTTEDYTFYPRPGWDDRFEHLQTAAHD